MNKWLLNNENVEIEKITYKNKELIINGINPVCSLNIGFNTDISKLEIGKKTDISKYIYHDQNFWTEKYSYVIEMPENIYLTRNDNDTFLFELNISNVNVLIPPYDNINKVRVNLDDKTIEIHKLDISVIFTTLE